MNGTAAGASAMAAAGVSREGPFGVGGVLGKTLSVWGRNVVAFGVVSLVFQSPVVVGNFFLGAPTIGQTDPDGFLRNGLTFVSALLSLAASGALTYGVLGALRGRPPGLGALLGFGLRSFGRVFAVSWLMGFFVLLGTLLLIVPGIIVALMLTVSVPAAVAEPQLGWGDALRRSRALTEGHRFTLFLALLVLYLVVMVVVMPLSMAAVLVPALQGGLAYGAINAVNAVLGGLFATCTAVAYHDLRVAKEGVGTEELAAVFD